MATGLMTLAYMAEMGLVFNVAYFELNGMRYIKAPMKEASELEQEITKSDAGPVDGAQWLKTTTEISDRLKRIFDDKSHIRQKHWYTRDRSKIDGQSPHKDLWAGTIFSHFSSGRDTEACQQALIISGVALTLMTVVNYFSGGEDYMLSRYLLVSGLLFGLSMFSWFLGFVFGTSLKTLSVIFLGLCIAVLGCHVWEPIPFPERLAGYQLSAWWFFFSLYAGSLMVPATCVAVGRRMRTHLRECISDARSEFEELKSTSLAGITNGK